MHFLFHWVQRLFLPISVCFGNLNGGTGITGVEVTQYTSESLKWLGNVLFYIFYLSVVFQEHGNLSADLYLTSSHFVSPNVLLSCGPGNKNKGIAHSTSHCAKFFL